MLLNELMPLIHQAEEHHPAIADATRTALIVGLEAFIAQIQPVPDDASSLNP